jgi:arylsulfatase A-like enzyme
MPGSKVAVACALLFATGGTALGLIHGFRVAVDNGYFQPDLRALAGLVLQSGAFEGARWGVMVGVIYLATAALCVPVCWLVTRSRAAATRAAPLLAALLILLSIVGYRINVAYLPNFLSATSVLVNLLLSVAFLLACWMMLRMFKKHRARTPEFRVPGALLGVLALVGVTILAGASVLRHVWKGNRAAGSPNVLIVVIDTLRPDRLGVYGYHRATSPNLDRLARESWVFTNGIAQASWTKPSMASIFTGLYVTQTSVRAGSWVVADREGSVWMDSLAPGLLTMTEVLAAAGYRTAAFGRNEHLLPTLGFSQGFETYVWWNAQRSLFKLPAGLKRLTRRSQSERTKDPERSSEWINERYLAWLGSHERDPHFAYLHYLDVHWPYRSPPPYSGMFSDAASPVDFNRREFMTSLTDALRTGELTTVDPGLLTAMSDAYDEGIRYVDDRLGEVLEALKQRGLYDNTLVIVTADHGEEFLEHGMLGHGESLYDEVIRVPLIVKFPCPGSHCGHRRIDSQVELVDIFPTLMQVADLEPGETLVGRSLLDPLAEGRNAYSEWEQSVSLRTPQWKLIYEQQEDSGELYHLTEDPGEKRNRFESDRVVVDLLTAHVLDFAATHRNLASAEGSTVEADQGMLENLRALGYVQ